MGRITLDDAGKRFGDETAVEDVSLEVADEEFLVLVGPSGCGKSTTLRMIAGLETPTEGSVYIDGDLMNFRVPQNRDIAMVFQDYALYPHMTVFENMRFGLEEEEGYTEDERDERVEEVAELLDIAELLDRKPDELSGGQQQRVGIARALAMDPKLLLFDEPTSALDPELIGEVLAVMRELADGGMTMLVVTHEMGFAREAATDLLFLDEGRILERGPPTQLFESPEHERTATFLRRLTDLEAGQHG